jgi:hypothetical protein
MCALNGPTDDPDADEGIGNPDPPFGPGPDDEGLGNERHTETLDDQAPDEPDTPSDSRD